MRKPRKYTTYDRQGGNPSNLAFKGAIPTRGLLGIKWTPFLNKAATVGTNPMIAPLVSAIGILSVRPAITMMDKKTPREDRIYSASWQAGVAVGGLGVLLPYGHKIKKVSNFIAEKLLDTGKDYIDKSGKFLGEEYAHDKFLADKKPHLVEAVFDEQERKRYQRLSPYPTLKQIIEMPDDKANQLVEKLSKQYSENNKFSFKDTIRSLNPKNVFNKNKKQIPLLETNPGLVHEIRENKEVVNKLLGDKRKVRSILARTGMGKVINFLTIMTALTGATFLITRYLDPIMETIGKTFNIKSLKNGVDGSKEKNSENSEEKKWGTFDKAVFGSLGAIVAIEGINLAGKPFKKANIAYEYIGKAFKQAGKAFKAVDRELGIGKTINNHIYNPLKELRTRGGFSNFKNKMREQANVNDRWVNRSVWFNLIGRTPINLGAGEPYNLIRDNVDCFMQLGFMGIAEKTIIKPVRKVMSKVMGVPEYNEGIKVIADQGIKNLLIVCTVMGFLNNAISSRFVKVLKKLGVGNAKKKESRYQQHKRNFLTAQHLYQPTSKNYAGKLRLIAPPQSNLGNKDEFIFADFLAKYNTENRNHPAYS